MFMEKRCQECNNELSQCGPQSVDGEPSLDCLVCNLRNNITQLTAQLEEARRDRERLDWLERKHYSYQRSSTGRYAFSILQFIPDGHNAMRDAIDAAMQQKEGK